MAISITPLHRKYHATSLWVNQQGKLAQTDSILTDTYKAQSNDVDLLLENYQYVSVQYNSSLLQLIVADFHEIRSIFFFIKWKPADKEKHKQQLNKNTLCVGHLTPTQHNI